MTTFEMDLNVTPQSPRYLLYRGTGDTFIRLRCGIVVLPAVYKIVSGRELS